MNQTCAHSGRDNVRQRTSCRGETSAQTVLLLPGLLLCLWIGVHVALLLHAGNVAAAAADAVARRASVEVSSTADLASAARAVVADLGGTLLPPVTIRRREATVAVEITVRGPSIVPFLPDRVTRKSVVPREMFLTEEQRR